MDQSTNSQAPVSDPAGKPAGAQPAGGASRTGAKAERASTAKSIVVRQHSAILYWWPVWLVGLVCALLSFAVGERITVGDQQMWFHPSRNLGVIYLAVFAIVFLRTNVVLRGVVSLLVVLSAIIAVLLLSLLNGWRGLFSLEQHLSVHMDAGFYLAMSTIVFLAWLLAVLVFDRFTYCEFRPGQLVVHRAIGGGIRTFDTRGISIYKLQDDMFRHWGLGLGTGDLHIATTGAEGITLDLRNVTFVDRKLASIKHMIAMSPDGREEKAT
jgi:hypothetical protein